MSNFSNPIIIVCLLSLRWLKYRYFLAKPNDLAIFSFKWHTISQGNLKLSIFIAILLILGYLVYHSLFYLHGLKSWGGCLGQKCCLLFVCVFGGVLRRVFRGGKICALYFKICQTYFEIGQTYFLFSPKWGKRSENQFSFFSVRKAVSGLRFPRRRLSALVRCGNGCLVRTKVSARP